MIIIDTPFHMTFSCTNDNPKYACTGKCKKSWWQHDFDARPTMGLCPQCQSGLTAASEGVHFKILKKDDRNLEINDFKGFNNISNEDIKNLDVQIKMGAKIGHLSKVKEKFISKALTEWCK